MSNFGMLSTMAYAAVVTWGFWRLTTISDWSVETPALLVFALVMRAARVFATMIHAFAMRGQA
jgi:hypothetical protein